MSDRRLEKRVDLDATPEQVWEAIATGPGISAWFVPHEVEPRLGGALSQRFGEGYSDTGRITAWEPGTRFAYRAAERPPEGSADYAFEFLVEAREGGGAVLRFVQSGFLDSEIRVKDRAAFADELTRAVTQVIANHHATEGERYRLLVAAHPQEDA